MSHSRSNNFKENTKNNPAESSQNENQMHFFAKPLIKCQMAASAMKQFYANSKITLKNLNIGHGEVTSRRKFKILISTCISTCVTSYGKQ